MPDRPFTILSTASMPLERIPKMPDSIHLVLIPFIEIIPRQDESLKKQISSLESKKTSVVFTSAQAVRSVTALLSKKPDWTIYCIRNETGLALENWFGKAYILRTAENAMALSDRIISDAIEEAYFFCGDQRLDKLPDRLKKQGVKLTELIVYETRLTPVRIENQPDAILFFSPTAVRSFFSVNSLSPATLIFALGKTTADELKTHTSLPVIVSTVADKAFVINMALEHAGSHPLT
jgi:uroporphyrinogen-III synthase